MSNRTSALHTRRRNDNLARLVQAVDLASVADRNLDAGVLYRIPDSFGAWCSASSASCHSVEWSGPNSFRLNWWYRGTQVHVIFRQRTTVRWGPKVCTATTDRGEGCFVTVCFRKKILIFEGKRRTFAGFAREHMFFVKTLRFTPGALRPR